MRSKAPERYLQRLQTFLTRLRVTLSREKTQARQAEGGFDFLGARLVLKPTRRNRGRKFCYGFPSPRAMKTIRHQIRTAMGRDHTKSVDDVIGYLNPVLRGWANYYNWLNSAEHFPEVERYVIQRLNRGRRRKQQRVRRSYRKLSGPELYQHGLYKITGRIAHVYCASHAAVVVSFAPVIGKPYEGKPHVRVDEGAVEIGPGKIE
jgi:RNA-directed DNA polymerase